MKQNKIRVNPKKVDIEKLISQKNLNDFREYFLSSVTDIRKWCAFNILNDIAINSVDFRLTTLDRRKKIYHAVRISLLKFFFDCLPSISYH